jgi:hypothetical protein
MQSFYQHILLLSFKSFWSNNLQSGIMVQQIQHAIVYPYQIFKCYFHILNILTQILVTGDGHMSSAALISCWRYLLKKTSGLHCSADVDCGFPNCDAVQYCRWLSTFPVLWQNSYDGDCSDTFPQNFGNHLGASLLMEDCRRHFIRQETGKYYWIVK